MNLVKLFFNRYPDTALPIIFLIIYIVCFYAFGQYLFNDFAAVLQQLTDLFNKYGALLVFVGGFIETLFAACLSPL
jgi:hypothetical protein